MAVAAGVRLQKMQEFVKSLFRGNVDFSILTHAIVRKKYLECAGQKRLSKEEKEQLKHLVEEELVQMKVDDPPADVELMPEFQDPFKPGDRKRSRCISDTSDEEHKNKQEQKKQRTAQKLEVSSEEEDSGIDSKKRPPLGVPKHPRKFSDFSDQGDSGAADHTAESGSDGPETKKKGKKPSQNARMGRQKAGTAAKGQWSRSSQDRLGSESEEATDQEQSDTEEELEGHRKTIEGNSMKKRDCKLWKQKKVEKEPEPIDTKSKGKNRKVNEQNGGGNRSDEENAPSTVEKICKKTRTDRSESEEEGKQVGHREGEGRTREETQKALKGNANEDGPESDFDTASGLQKKMASSRRRRKSLSTEGSGSSSDDSVGQRQARNKIGKGRTRRASAEKPSRPLGRQPKLRRMKKVQSGNASRKEREEEGKMAQKVQESRKSTSEESESEAGTCQGLKEGKGWALDATSSDGESQSEEVEDCESGPRKVTVTNKTSESEPGERKSRRGQRKDSILKRKDKVVSGSDSSAEEEEPEQRGTQKSPRKNVSSAIDSEDSGSGFGAKKKRQGQQKTTEKLKRRSKSREKEGDELVKEETFSSGEGEATSRQQPLGKDKKHHSGKSEDHPSIQRLKRYIRECGVRRNYKKLLAGCRSRRAQIEVLRQELETLGLKGTPSLAKCKALKQKREEAAEMASLDISNIIVMEGRPKRHNAWSLYSKSQGPATSPEELPVRRHTIDWSHLRGVISSDEESS